MSTSATARGRWRWRGALLCAALAWQASAMAQAVRNAAPAPAPALAPASSSVPALAPLRFGILPFGGAVESRDHWTPLLSDLSRAIGRPVAVLSVTSYESLDQAIRRNEVDFALLSAKMALDAVTERRMKVLAEVRRNETAPAHRALLLVREGGALGSLDALLADPGRWRIARGDSLSVSGFIVPQVQLFLPNRIAIETAFRSEIIETHQGTALAVANGDADVATNNTTDLERFRAQFPVEAARLRVIWRSEPTPPAQIVARRDMPAEMQKKLQDFLANYGQSSSARGDAEREVLSDLRASLGYRPADDTALLPAAALEHQLAWQRALGAAWVNEAARQARLRRIENAYANQVNALRAGTPSPSRLNE